MTIYVDVVLIENLCMNYIILFATAYIMKLKIRQIRIILSSFIGAIYAILVYSNASVIYSNLVVKVILSITMTYIAINTKNIYGLLKELALFYLVSFALGGCAFALLYIVKPQEILMKNGIYIGSYPIKIAILGGILGFVITYIAFKTVKNMINKNEIIYEVEIKLNEKIINTKLLLDTGNMLKDPLSKSPVILIEKKIIKELIDEKTLEYMENIVGGEINDDIEKYRTRIRIIPFSSVGKQNGIMPGIKIDEIKIITDIDEIIRDDVIVCSYNKSFSKSKKYFGLLGIDILERRDKVEHFTNIKK